MLLARIQTAVIAIAGILLVLFVLPPALLQPIILLVVAAAAWEWSALARLQSAAARLAYVALIVAGCLALWLALPATALPGVLLLTACWWLVAFVLVCRYPLAIPHALAFAAGLFVLLPAFVALSALARYPATAAITGPALLLFVLSVVWAADVGGYFAGKYLGRRKLAPAVSPKKTWAGVVGGLAAATAVGVAGSMLFELAWFRLVPLCVATAAVSVVGDLTVSLFKREAGVKDSGVLFPGHGGVLDRIDSIAAATPLFVAGIVAGHGPW